MDSAGSPGHGAGEFGKQLARVTCPQCGQVIEFSGLRPHFCGFCGKPLPGPTEQTTIVPVAGPEAPTLAPRVAPAPPSATEGEIIGGYRLLRCLGSGGMGTVYEAEDSCGRRVALKLIAGAREGSDDTLERFRREGRLASAIAHPRCVFVLAADEDAGRPYIVMELMPGATLADVLRERGPLPPGEAVARIVDVIDGLREAHRLGVVHRDIKPSNCFVDAEGRVKVGDFGLSKSLIGDTRLTQTGAFLGTPLFASPEQVRSEPLGPQSDVYSLAATLYCLLTGRAPFEGGDAAATLARIAADPAPSMRTLRPELSPALDRAVLRGLERDRRRRWRDLDEFKEALLPFVPGRQEAAGRTVRFAAFLVDLVLLKFAATLWALIYFTAGLAPEINQESVQPFAVQQMAIEAVVWLLYFVLTERFWGASIGKLLLRLRVSSVLDQDSPGWGRALLRFAVFYVLLSLEQLALLPRVGSLTFQTSETAPSNHVALALHPLQILGIGLLLATMRRRNGWRGLHEFASGTRVIQLPQPSRRRMQAIRPIGENLASESHLPEKVGAFEVRGALRWDDQTRVLLGEDPGLGRSVLLWLRPAGAAPLSSARRACARATRLRWLATGEQDGWHWDAFPAPAGRPLADFVASEGPLGWPETRPALEQLTDELLAAENDGTLPEPLTLVQVWLQPDCSVLLLDVGLFPKEEKIDRSNFQSQPLGLLAQTAVRALEGAPMRSDGPIRAIVPQHARQLLDRLVGGDRPFQDVRDLQAELEVSRGSPTEVTSAWRAALVVVQSACFSPGLVIMLALGWLAGLPALVALYVEQKEDQWLQQYGTITIAGDFASEAFNPVPLARATAAYQSQRDLDEFDRIGKRQQGEEQEFQARLRAADWLNRGLFHRIAFVIDRQEAMERQRQDERSSLDKAPAEYRSVAARREQEHESAADIDATILKVSLFVFTIWPGLCVLGGFLARGGLALNLMGLSFVGGDGQRAGRLRCAWRAFVIWAPLAMVLLAAVALETTARSSAAAVVGAGLVPWVVAFLRWSSLGLLAMYGVAAIRSPQRTVHDRLAGTYLVPR